MLNKAKVLKIGINLSNKPGIVYRQKGETGGFLESLVIFTFSSPQTFKLYFDFSNLPEFLKALAQC
jgi:hypothetical protein